MNTTPTVLCHEVFTSSLHRLDAYDGQPVHGLRHAAVDHLWNGVAQFVCCYEVPDKNPDDITICLSREAVDTLNAQSPVRMPAEVVAPDRFNFTNGEWHTCGMGEFEDLYVRSGQDSVRRVLRFKRTPCSRFPAPWG